MKAFILKYLFLFAGCVSLIAFLLISRPPAGNSGKTIVKIESIAHEGMYYFPMGHVKTFDFENLEVTQEHRISQEDYQRVIDDESFAVDIDYYNNSEFVISFTESQKADLLEAITACGIYNWDERYITSDIIMDAGGFEVVIYFDDGTVKSTYMFFSQPSNFDTVCSQFPKYIGTDLKYGFKYI